MDSKTAQHHLFLGTYTKGASKGIYSSVLGPDGALSQPEVAAEAPNPTFLALSPDRRALYAVCAGHQWASSFRVDAERFGLAPVEQRPAGAGPTPCHICVDPEGRIAVAANYHLGLAAAIPLGASGTLGEPRVVEHRGRGPNPKRQDSAHVHSAYFTPDGNFALVCDLGLDRIYTYAVDRKTAALLPGSPPYVATEPGAGPRHLAFGRDARQVYAINELGNTITAYDFAAQRAALTPRTSVSVLPPGYVGESTAAEVCVHPNGRFVYGSARGPDSISVFEAGVSGDLSPVENVPCGGRGPRSFALSPDGGWLVCAHQDSDTLCSFRVDPSSGRLERIPGTVSVPMPVCVLFLD